jgi:hypothetical protein
MVDMVNSKFIVNIHIGSNPIKGIFYFFIVFYLIGGMVDTIDLGSI